MHTDFAILTGARHTMTATVCEDYCLAETTGKGAFAVIADGCSSAARTDLGARAWTLAAMECMRSIADNDAQDGRSLQTTLLGCAEPALQHLEYNDGFATVGMLHAAGGRVTVALFGDGALLLRHCDGRQTLINVQCTANAPFYLNYLRRPETAAAWALEYEHQELLVVENHYSAEGELLALKTSTQSGNAAWIWLGDIARDEIEMALLATDGVGSRDAGFVATARQLLAVKSPAGEFLRRRVGSLAREWSKTGTMPSDDLAVAGIWLGQEPAIG